MITKREKLQYIYVFLTDLVVLLLSTLLAWLVTDGLLKQLVPYAPSDWVQTICLLMLAFVATFICFDQTENIVTRTSGEEIKLSIKFNVLLALVYSTAMLLTKAEMLDSRYFTLAVPLINFVLLPIAHGLLKRSLLQIQSQSGLESLVGLISTQDRAELLINELQRDWSKRISGVAILEAPASEIGSTLAGVPVTANYDNFMDWIRQAALDEIYVDIPMDSGESFIPVLEEMESMGLTVHFRLLLLDPSLAGQMGGITGEGFSSPLLGKVFDLLLRRANEGLSTQLSALSGHLSGEEMDHLAYVVSQPESLAHSQQSIRDYISVIQREALRRGAGQEDSLLLAAQRKYQEKKAYMEEKP